VIDFYRGNALETGKAAGIYLDVRPALDNVGAAVDRVQMYFSNLFGAKQQK
jgi:hypothetical protein